MIPDWFIWVAVVISASATFLALIRAFIGPTTSDRIAAVDNMTTVTASLFMILALVLGTGIYIDVAMVYAILSFIGILVFARYLEGGL